MKNLFLAAVLFFAGKTVFSQSDSAFIAQNFTKIERRISMRDGVRLFTSIYIPKDASAANPYPFLMERTPYSVEPYGEKMPFRLGPNPFLMQKKYIFVYQDVRGRYMSEGKFEEMTPNQISEKATDESSDTYDTVDWLLKNVAGNNGRVGIYGISYPGFYATAALPEAHPAIKAVSPQAPVTDEFLGDDAYHNGAFFLMDNFSFTNYFDVPRDSPTTNYDELAKVRMNDAYQFYLDLGPLKNCNDLYFKNRARIWNEYLDNDFYSKYWQKRNIRTTLKNVRPATLVVGGWFDAEDLFGALHTFEAIEKQSPSAPNFLVMGPWTHGAWERKDWSAFASHVFGQNTARYFQEEIETPFFEFYLKDIGSLHLPKATIFETESNVWNRFDAFPPKNGVEKAIFFQPDGRLSFEKSKARADFTSYISDPAKPVPYIDGIFGYRKNEYMAADQRFAATRPDVLVFQTEVLSDDLTLAGPLRADLFVSTTGSDADFVVKLIDVLPENPTDAAQNKLADMQRLVRAEVMRGKFRDDFSDPKPFVSGKIAEVAFDLNAVSHTFKKGHRLMVQVQSSWFPLVDRNPQVFMHIPEATAGDFHRAEIRLFHDAAHPSALKMRVLEK